MMILTRLLERLTRHPPAVATAAALSEFLDAQAAFVSQKCTIEYCRARAGLFWDKLFREPAFNAALDVSRWEAFAAVLGDLTLVVEGRLRAHAPGRAHLLADRLAAMAVAILDGHGAPAHRESWNDVAPALRRRLAEAQLAAPKTAGDIGYHAGVRVFDTLPIHPRLRGHDRLLITNNIRFGLVRSAETMHERLDLPALAAALTAEP